MNMLEAGAKVPLVTDDPMYTQRQKIQDMETLEITTIADGAKIWQVPTAATTETGARRDSYTRGGSRPTPRETFMSPTRTTTRSGESRRQAT